MSFFRYILPVVLLSILQACGQIGDHRHLKVNSMDYDHIENIKVREAIQAWQKGDSALWLSYFTSNAKLFDDGHPRDFKKFVAEAIGHERFTSIDKIEKHGLEIYGEFHSDTWGDFKTYFKFHLNKEGKFQQLEIGQAHY